MLLGQLQENLICLVAFDDQYAAIIRNSVPLNLWGGPFKTIASHCYDYLDSYHQPPKDHIADLLADKLNAEGSEGQLYADIVDSIYGAYEGLNKEYILNELELFIKRQSLRTIAVDLTKALQKDTNESLEEADNLIRQAGHQALKLFDPGIRLSDKQRSLKFLDISNESFPTGIEELDRRGFGPTRKELWLLIANTKSGKSWGLMHLAKMALMHRLRVCHITLEMSAERCAQRYFQALFSVSKRKETQQTTKFKRDDLGRITGFDDLQLSPRYTLQDPEIRQQLERVINKWSVRLLDNIFIKQFPTGALTVAQLKAYLDTLDATQKFTPDLLIIDYPDLMKLDRTNYRISIDEMYKDLRGLAFERNLALAAVSQSNRAAAKAKVVGGDNVAEAYSKIAHADCVMTLSSTEAERKLGLARLCVVAGRNDQDGITLVISQAYGLGSFVIDSALMSADYWQNLPGSDDDD
jgi:hypothetical protein